MPGKSFSLEVQARVPEAIARLEELANDLVYSWNRQIRALFARLDPQVWEGCGHNPRLFLRRVAQQRLDEAAQDRVFIEDYQRVLATFNHYRKAHNREAIAQYLDPDQDLIAYFCAEFGLHESLPIYSGGLGILAGDHCKAASDLNLPFVAVGLLYRQGYFTQTIDGHGNQVAHYHPTNFDTLPVRCMQNAAGEELRVTVPMPGRTALLRIWQARVGHIDLYLLDSDLPENQEADRAITYQLYGGDIHTRIQQEIVLGIGGVRALRCLGIHPSAWHINEGHAAFQVLERCRELVREQGFNFASALEQVAAGTCFTTHTPVAAGHDVFDHHLMATYFGDYAHDLGLSMDEFLLLGASPAQNNGFNQTALALRGSRFHNGVSAIHGAVAAEMEGYIWPQIPHAENPIRHVTNGVHLPTFLANEWAVMFDLRFGREWRDQLLDERYWERVDEIANHSYWSVRQLLKADLLEDVRRRYQVQCRRNGQSQALIDRATRYLNPHEPDVLVIGFARRFATYKRATLIFSDPARLARILSNSERPVVLIFAGKAHPSDLPGQHLIQVVHDFARRPEFLGRIIMVEGYDMALARKLLAGVDVWLNNPEYPLEASGTSGQKAGMNGVLNLSVLDGWWGEGYNGDNGWAIVPRDSVSDLTQRNQEESHELLDILEHQVVPLYYERDGHGYSEGWVRMSKAAVKSIVPQFNAQRMVMDYVRAFYAPASRQARRLAADQGRGARDLAAWKARVRAAWSRVALRLEQAPPRTVMAGDPVQLQVIADLHGLSPGDVMVECLIGTSDASGHFADQSCFPFLPSTPDDRSDGTRFELELHPPLAGLQQIKIRMYPRHALLSHPFETGLMLWL